ncbi:auxin-induced protein 15A-like [Camellia sinensis]|uniref:auxin-induced protein 15A-like n=1 Tax=Camellia sinensis TaxID=4442 RepID=UPI001035FEF9|nr:auxin-induced protein 15A-like [Camellia sinensis]
MGIWLPRIVPVTQIIFRARVTSEPAGVPKGHFAVYVGEIQKKRFVVPISYLDHPTFQILLSQAEEEFGYDHPMGGLTIPCREEAFIDRMCGLNAS